MKWTDALIVAIYVATMAAALVGALAALIWFVPRHPVAAFMLALFGIIGGFIKKEHGGE